MKIPLDFLELQYQGYYNVVTIVEFPVELLVDVVSVVWG